MDEVFDLKERNQWLRRNIKNLLQQLIRATYGDTINRYHIFFYSSSFIYYLAFKVLLLEVNCSAFLGEFPSLGPLRTLLKQSISLRDYLYAN